jgi:hypothetical protein
MEKEKIKIKQNKLCALENLIISCIDRSDQVRARKGSEIDQIKKDIKEGDAYGRTPA